jgi:hypothetical protein
MPCRERRLPEASCHPANDNGLGFDACATHGDRIFYRQALLACAGDRWHHIAFEYPSNVKLSMTDFVRRAAQALEAKQNAGCDIPVSSAE